MKEDSTAARDTPDGPKKILIVSVRANAGHIKAAEALRKAFAIRYPTYIARNVDLLDYSGFPARQLRNGIDLVKKLPEAYAYSYRKHRGIDKLSGLRLLFDRINAGAFLDLLESYKPDAVVATHFAAAALAADFRDRNKKAFPVFITITDYEIHSFWIVRSSEIEQYSVAHEEMKIHLEMMGVPEKRIRVAGIPVDPAFNTPKDATGLKVRYGIPQGPPVILLMAGSSGATPVLSIIEYLRYLEADFSMIVVCGRNRQLYNLIRSTQSKEHRIVLVYEFVDFVDELMHMSNLLISKPGGITVSESLALGVPMLLIHVMPGHEQANADYLLEQGAASLARSPESLIFKLRGLFNHPERLLEMKERCARIAKPLAAFTIADEVVRALWRKAVSKNDVRSVG